MESGLNKRVIADVTEMLRTASVFGGVSRRNEDYMQTFNLEN
jgi:hypothetical protein